MANLGNRIQKIENAIDNMPGGSKEVMMFFRKSPDDHVPKKWIERHPGFTGKVHIFSFGTKNLGLQHELSTY
jgi:hypothetical protein